MKKIFQKHKDGHSSSQSIRKYTSSDESGATKNGSIERSASKPVSTPGFYSVPDEGTDIYTYERTGDEEPLVIGEVNSGGVKKFNGKNLLQGERYITNKDRSSNVSIKKDGETSITTFTKKFLETDENGEVVQKNSESNYQKVCINPKTECVSIEIGTANYSNEQVLYEKKTGISITKLGEIKLESEGNGTVGKVFISPSGDMSFENNNGGMVLGANGVINLN